MAALPSPIRPSRPHRLISERKIAANRRNAGLSTGPRTAEGKARVARNAVKHGFFAGLERWTPEDRQALHETLAALREEFAPTDGTEERRVATMAATHIRLTMLLRYEGIAAHNYHLQRELEMSDRIANAEPAEAARLEREGRRSRSRSMASDSAGAPHCDGDPPPRRKPQSNVLERL